MVVKTLIVTPILVVFLSTFALSILEFGEEASDKTIQFADDANNAIDCAFKGVSLNKCSPDLVSTDFKAELEDYKTINEEFLENLEEQI